MHVLRKFVCSLLALCACSATASPPARDASTGDDASSTGGGSAIPNPTGTCQAPDDGSRRGYHSSDGTAWLPDCKSPLRREYWRVFAESADSAFVIPRPDGAPELEPVCNDTDHALNPIVRAHALCASAAGQADLELVNHNAPADALAVTHFMHGVLRFTTSGSGIAPFPLPSDIIDACDLHPEAASTALRAMCDRERDRLQSGNDIGFSYEGPGAIELADLLNELYGVP